MAACSLAFNGDDMPDAEEVQTARLILLGDTDTCQCGACVLWAAGTIARFRTWYSGLKLNCELARVAARKQRASRN